MNFARERNSCFLSFLLLLRLFDTSYPVLIAVRLPPLKQTIAMPELGHAGCDL